MRGCGAMMARGSVGGDFRSRTVAERRRGKAVDRRKDHLGFFSVGSPASPARKVQITIPDLFAGESVVKV